MHIPFTAPLDHLAVLERQTIDSLAKNPQGYDAYHTTRLAVIATLRQLIVGDTQGRTWLSGIITRTHTNADLLEWRTTALRTLARLPVDTTDTSPLTTKYFIAFQILHNMEIEQ